MGGFFIGGNVTKEEVIVAMKDCTAKLGRAPSYPELNKAAGVMKWDIRRNFGTYGRLLKACGCEPRGTGYPLAKHAMFIAWAGVVRNLRKIPTQMEFEEQTQRQGRILTRKLGGWHSVPQRMLEYMRMEHLEGEWKDVLEVILKHLDPSRRPARPENVPRDMPVARQKVMIGQPMYGTPLLTSPLSCAPINEMGVVFLFGSVAREMGFVVTRLQQEFPDCEALRQVQPGRWQRVLIEFEYESRNFLVHDHKAEDCDLIICWNHNWPECPLEVLELKYAPCIQLSGIQF
jgi:hypothetical protein